MSKKNQFLMIIFLLATVTFIAFWQVHHNDFVNYDDPDYITQNSHIQNGVTMGGIRWALTTHYGANWHPLTWTSHMLDIQFFGLKPGWHHLTSLLLHILNTILLFLVFHRMTKALWQSAFVAALFALHPLHVESVAWAAERKDVLSAFFWMLTMAAYVYYTERPGFQRYLPVVLFFVLGLMAKPMLITLPFVLLLLDYWPLQRFRQKKSVPEIRTESDKPAYPDKRKGKSKKRQAVKETAKAEKPAGSEDQGASIYFLIREKIPLFALTVLSGIVTYIAQQKGGAVGSMEAFPLNVRIANAFVSYIRYIGQMIWPDHLAVFYPHPGLGPSWQISGAVLLLAAVTLVVIRTAKRFPYLSVGWLWYVGTLVPVIGLVQVGSQARADRYTYIPLIGLFIIAAWGVPALLEKWRHRKAVLLASSALILACLFVVTWKQAGYWQNSITLFDHTLNVTDRNYLAHNNRGVAYEARGDRGRAIRDYDRSIEYNPKYAEAYNNRGVAYGRLGDYGRAIEDYDRAIERRPGYEKAYYNRGVAYCRLGDFGRAVKDYDRAIELNPTYVAAYNNRGIAFDGIGNYRQAMGDFDRVIELNPKDAEAHYNRGTVYYKIGNFSQAVADYNRAIELNPGYAEAYYNRGTVYGRLGNQRQFYEDLRRAARLGNGVAQAVLRKQGIVWQ